MADQLAVFFVLGVTLVLFIHGRWRYDIVALGALLTLTVARIVPASDAFLGFGHPAVITVAAVLTLSTGLQNAGVVDAMVRVITHITKRPLIQMLLLNFFVLVISAFMNNVGALAILLPVAMQLARSQNRPPSQFLMPLAFCSLLGGMTTQIGTPPNIIVAAMRGDILGSEYTMFSFTPVGVAVAIGGFIFLSLFGWRLIPKRQGGVTQEELFEVEGYLTELRVPEDSKAADLTLRELEELVDRDVVVFGIVRGGKKLSSPPAAEQIRVEDILIVESDPDTLQQLMDLSGLESMTDKELGKELIGSDELTLSEVVVRPGARIVGRRVRNLHLRWRFGVTLLAVSRQGSRVKDRLGKIVLRAGDVLLLRGSSKSMQEALPIMGCLPLAERNLRYGEPRRLIQAGAIFGTAVAAAISGLVPIAIAFVLAVIVMHLVGLIRLREVYASVDLPIVVLLAALIPVGKAMEMTGGAQLIADQIVALCGNQSPVIGLIVLLVGTMFLSDLVNNATAAILMVPIAHNVAVSFGVNSDSYLMAVAIGASCPFLTPIGHQSNALVMGPGGYRFSDYWRVGLPLEVLIVAIAIPALLVYWPL